MGWKDTLDILKDKTIDLAQAGVAQSKRLAEIAKLKTANMAEEDAMKKAYIEIGKLYYAENSATAQGAYAAACDKITAAKAAIEVNNERIDELKDKADEDEDDDIIAEESVPAQEPAVEVPVAEPSDIEEPVAEEPKPEA